MQQFSKYSPKESNESEETIQCCFHQMNIHYIVVCISMLFGGVCFGEFVVMSHYQRNYNDPFRENTLSNLNFQMMQSNQIVILAAKLHWARGRERDLMINLRNIGPHDKFQNKCTKKRILPRTISNITIESLKCSNCPIYL